MLPSGQVGVGRMAWGVARFTMPAFNPASEPPISTAIMVAKNEVAIPIRIVSLSNNVSNIDPRLNKELTFGEQQKY